MKPLVNRDEIRLAMLGMVEGNGHPFSWSAIINGYDKDAMAKGPYPLITEYLRKQPPETFGIPGTKVTHVWTDNPNDAVQVSRCSLVPNVVDRAEDVIGHVDAVIVATDNGSEHVDRCRPFVEVGLPVFVDKPLVDNIEDLRIFRRWISEGKAIMSSSCMRYCKEFAPYRMSSHDLGELRLVCTYIVKTWERYGIHALESAYPILGPGFVSARNTGTCESNIVHCKHRSGADLVAATCLDMYGSFGILTLCGTKDHAELHVRDFFYCFKAQLAEFVKFLRTGVRPFPFDETDELMRLIIAGIWSREQGGREVLLSEIE